VYAAARTTVFGAMNAKNLRGAFNRHESVSDNVALSGPLLSRFDIVLVLLDDKDPGWDDAISRHIIRNHQSAVRFTAAQQVLDPTLRMFSKLVAFFGGF
jgi:DNA helicase MCM9